MRVDEQRVAGRTRKMDWGEQWMVMISSGVNGLVGWDKISNSIDFEMIIRDGSPSAFWGRATWNENGTGSSSYSKLVNVRG